MSERYLKSEKLRERALKSIPSGAQIFNKTADHLPLGAAPFFAAKAKGSTVRDVDDNTYIDFINASAAITLGHCDEDVTLAVQRQLTEGTIFSLSHALEIEVAEQIIELVPCAESVQFSKNGSDATTAAIRLARAFTKRDRVAIAGYHGWHDWYIGETKYNLGVPQAVKELTHRFQFNNIDSLYDLLQKFLGEFAAIILEPLADNGPQNEFLGKVQALANQHGIILIFDEIVSGFRCALGGAQELYSVTPDLVTLGKGLANGYPLSAIAGSANIMQYMEKIFCAATFSGETLSLAASLATMKKLKTQPVIEHLKNQGKKIIIGLKQLINTHELAKVIMLNGYSAQFSLKIRQTEHYSMYQIRTFILQELFAKGILLSGTHNISYAHSDQDIAYLLAAYDQIFSSLNELLREKKLEMFLKCSPLVPNFQIKQYDFPTVIKGHNRRKM